MQGITSLPTGQCAAIAWSGVLNAFMHVDHSQRNCFCVSYLHLWRWGGAGCGGCSACQGGGLSWSLYDRLLGSCWHYWLVFDCRLEAQLAADETPLPLLSCHPAVGGALRLGLCLLLHPSGAQTCSACCVVVTAGPTEARGADTLITACCVATPPARGLDHCWCWLTNHHLPHRVLPHVVPGPGLDKEQLLLPPLSPAPARPAPAAAVLGVTPAQIKFLFFWQTLTRSNTQTVGVFLGTVVHWMTALTAPHAGITPLLLEVVQWPG